MKSPEILRALANSSATTRRDFLKLAGAIGGGIIGGTLIREHFTQASSSPENPINWVNSTNQKIKELFNNASSGRFPYNNPYRPVADIYRWINIPDTSFPTVTYQPWEGLYEETQAGPGVSLEVGGLLPDTTFNKEYILTIIMASQDGNKNSYSIETIQNASDPTDYSHAGRTRTKDVLSQSGGVWTTTRVTSFVKGIDPTNNRKYIEFSYENEYVPSEKGTQRSYLDNNGNPTAFIVMPQAEPSPTRTATPNPTSTPYPTATPISRRQFFNFLPVIDNRYPAGGK